MVFIMGHVAHGSGPSLHVLYCVLHPSYWERPLHSFEQERYVAGPTLA